MVYHGSLRPALAPDARAEEVRLTEEARNARAETDCICPQLSLQAKSRRQSSNFKIRRIVCKWCQCLDGQGMQIRYGDTGPDLRVKCVEQGLGSAVRDWLVVTAESSGKNGNWGRNTWGRNRRNNAKTIDDTVYILTSSVDLASAVRRMWVNGVSGVESRAVAAANQAASATRSISQWGQNGKGIAGMLTVCRVKVQMMDGREVVVGASDTNKDTASVPTFARKGELCSLSKVAHVKRNLELLVGVPACRQLLFSNSSTGLQSGEDAFEDDEAGLGLGDEDGLWVYGLCGESPSLSLSMIIRPEEDTTVAPAQDATTTLHTSHPHLLRPPHHHHANDGASDRGAGVGCGWVRAGRCSLQNVNTRANTVAANRKIEVEVYYLD